MTRDYKVDQVRDVVALELKRSRAVLEAFDQVETDLIVLDRVRPISARRAITALSAYLPQDPAGPPAGTHVRAPENAP